MVFQEQFQVCEQCIEEFELNIVKFDFEVFMKIFKWDDEISWFCEFFVVCYGDFQDIIVVLLSEYFNRERVKDVVICFKVNL